jgi:hypothetical protein
MKKACFVLFLLAMALVARGDSVRFTRIQGGPPLPGVSDAKKDLGTVEGDEFKKLKPQIQSVSSALVNDGRWLPQKAVWWDVGPDAGYVSAVIEIDGKTYTINSWYPLERQSSRVAVSEAQGLVSVKSRTEKQEVESKNSTAYKRIVSIFDYIPQLKSK